MNAATKTTVTETAIIVKSSKNKIVLNLHFFRPVWRGGKFCRAGWYELTDSGRREFVGTLADAIAHVEECGYSFPG